jgi:hypothetical protein
VGFLEGESAFESADEVADLDVSGAAGEAVAAAGADFGFEESASAEGEEDGFEELVGEGFGLGQVFGLDEVARPEAGELDDGSEAVFGAFGQAQGGSRVFLLEW